MRPWLGSGPVLAALMALMAGCSTANSASAVPASDMQESRAEPLLITATSGPFSRLAERTDIAQAEMVIWDDGLVAVNVGERLDPNYRALQLPANEFADLKRLIAESNLRSFSASSASYGACIDCPVNVIRMDVSGRLVEIAFRGVVATSEYRYVTEYPDGLVQLREALNRLGEEVRDSAESPELSRDIPVVPVAPQSGG